MDFIITTVHKPSEPISEQAKQAAQLLGSVYIERENYSFEYLRNRCGVATVVVYGQQGPRIITQEGDYFFHLNMAGLRIKNIINGKPDHMVSSMQLVRGMSVLDCTLGLATDAIVASFISGSEGQIIGLESSPLIAWVASYGLKHFSTEEADLTAALRRIEVINSDYHDYLQAADSDSIDVIYFDPMFRHPVHKSSNFKPLRTLVDTRPLTLETLHQAYRVARKRVIIKETNGSTEFNRLGINTIVGGRYSSVQYGIIEVGEAIWKN